MSYEFFEIERRGHTATLWLNRPEKRNALGPAFWNELPPVIGELERDAAVRAVVLAGRGRDFTVGLDLKAMGGGLFDGERSRFSLLDEIARLQGSITSVAKCTKPVIAAVHGYCLGGGIGLVGNADVIVAADDATFGLPEVDRGALGAATHLARLVPQHKMRAMVYTSATATAAELHAFGSVLQVVPRDELRGAARAVAEQIAAKSPTVIRAAKESLNGIDPIDVKRSYRFEQGFTFELNLSGVADEHRDAFVEGRETRHSDTPATGGNGGGA